jgi:hypothetical protein
MRPSSFLLVLLLQAFLGSYAQAKLNCPLYGATFPKPSKVGQHQGAQEAASALDDAFSKYIDNDNTTGSSGFSYAVEVFHTNATSPLWSHYWTAPNLKAFNSTGVARVDTDTVFRIGSITKIYTILAFLAAVGDEKWNDPIAKYIPEIAELARMPGSSPISSSDWDSITIGSLASQTSGLIRDCGSLRLDGTCSLEENADLVKPDSLLGEVTQDLALNDLYALGFPPIPLVEIPPCGDIPVCNRSRESCFYCVTLGHHLKYCRSRPAVILLTNFSQNYLPGSAGCLHRFHPFRLRLTQMWATRCSPWSQKPSPARASPIKFKMRF